MHILFENLCEVGRRTRCCDHNNGCKQTRRRINWHEIKKHVFSFHLHSFRPKYLIYHIAVFSDLFPKTCNPYQVRPHPRPGTQDMYQFKTMPFRGRKYLFSNQSMNSCKLYTHEHLTSTTPVLLLILQLHFVIVKILPWQLLLYQLTKQKQNCSCSTQNIPIGHSPSLEDAFQNFMCDQSNCKLLMIEILTHCFENIIFMLCKIRYIYNFWNWGS